MIQLTRTGAIVSGSSKDLERLRRQFRRQHYLRLPGYLAPCLLRLVLEQIEKAEFTSRADRVASELILADPLTTALLDFVTNDPLLLKIIEQLTGRHPIRGFIGRAYRMLPQSSHHLVWHDDLVNGRLVALSVNLSLQEYSGGNLQIRSQATRRILQEVSNPGLGDGLLVDLSEKLEHRVTAVDGSAPRTTLAGWFTSRRGYHFRVRQATRKLRV